MPRFFVSRYRRDSTPTVAVRRLWRFSPKLIMLFVVAGLCLFYVWQMTALSMRGYVMNDLLRQRSVLSNTIEQARLTVLDHQSLARVEERLGELNLVRDPNVDYVTREELRLSLSVR